MKKVLTLMGALSVAGSALAYDYDWALSNLGEDLDWTKGVSKNGLTYKGTTNSQWDAANKGVVSDVKGSSQANCFTFKVQEGDNVIVHAINTGTSPKGFVYLEQTKVVGDQEETATVSNAEIDNSGTKQLEVTNMLGGTVYIYAEAGVVITKITVVSAKYREVVEEIKKASDAEEAARQEFIKLYLSDTNNTFNGFYDAIHKQLSNIAQKRLKIEATLRKEAANNNVSVKEEGSAYDTKGDELKAALQALYADGGEIDQLKKNADDAMKAYKSVVTSNGTNAVALAKKALDTANNDPKKENNKTVYGESDDEHIYNPITNSNGEAELDSKGKVKGNVERATGLKDYIDKNADQYLTEMKDAALADLSEFPSWKDAEGEAVTTYPTAKHNAAILKTVERVHNSIYRKVYEQNHGSEYTDLQTELTTIANDIDAAGCLTTPDNLATLKTEVDDLVTKLNGADKHTMNADAIKKNFITNLEKYKGEKNTIKTNLLTEAKNKLKEKYDAVQTLLTDKSAQITELFNGQENTQAEYAVKFGQLQVSLNKVKTAETYEACVTGYNTLVSEITRIEGEINTMWQEALDSQSGEIVGQNNAAFKTLEDLINGVVDIFNEGVKKINGYKDIPDITTSAKATIDGELANMFKSREDIVKALNDATTAKNEANNAPVKSFDASGYTATVNKAKSDIETSISNARTAANTYAYYYLTRPYSKTNVGTLAYAKNQINSALYIIGKRNADLSDYTTWLYDAQYTWHGKSKVSEDAKAAIDVLLEEYVTAQDDLIEAWNKTNEVPDHISEVTTALEPLGGKLTAILDQVVVYDEIDANITQKKVNWTVLKANVKPREDVDIDGLFTDINKKISDLETKLSEAGLDAKKEEFQASLDKIAYDLKMVGDYDGYLAEQAALSTLNTRIAAVDNLVKNDAKKDLSETIVTEDILNYYVNQIEALQDYVANVQKIVDKYYKDFELRKNVDAVEAMLKAIEDEVARLVAAAKADDKAAQEIPGDVNGDKSVDAADYEIIKTLVKYGDEIELDDNQKDYPAKADLNKDGKVSFTDLSEFVKLYKGKEQE